MRTHNTALLLTLFLLILSCSLLAETVLQQGFESSPNDTWSYTAIPEPNRAVWWGATDQPLGGASAQSEDWYWASWDLDDQSHALEFESIQLSPGYIYSINFYYFTKGLSPATDYSRYCLEYDDGYTWTNWQNLQPDTNAWTHLSMEIPVNATSVRLKVEALYDGLSKYAHWDAFSLQRTLVPPLAPTVQNVSAFQRRDGSKIVDIHYDVFDANDEPLTVSLLLSDNGGESYNYQPNIANLSGDIGEDISTGTGKHIIWNAGAEGTDFDGSIYRVRVSAQNNIYGMPENFVFVGGGTFHNGTSNVTVSSFYLDKYVMTQAGYQAVMGTNPAHDFGVGADYPVYYVSWFNAIEYCNRRSMQEDLAPCYSYSTYGTDPANWPSGWNNSSNHYRVSCNWTANGYRLPTEMEWMFAARGGNQTHNYVYSGSNNLDSVGWYNANNNPIGTKQVGRKAPNELGLYDMSGNLWELVWDIHSSSYPSGAQIDPTGATEGTGRLSRGGSWPHEGVYCTVSYRNFSYPTDSVTTLGFRVCRPLLSGEISTVASPVFSPEGGSSTTPYIVSISSATAGASIYYSTDGSDPDESSLLYTNPLTISTTTTLKARAYKELWLPSSIATAVYQIAPVGFVYVPGGTFIMGDTRGEGESDELPTRSVTLSPFYMSKYELKQSEYTAVMDYNPAQGFGTGDNHPVYFVSWYSALKYCNLRSLNEELTPVYTISGFTDPADWGVEPSSNDIIWNAVICNWSANGYRLPTEAEWEYAARGGSPDPDYMYSGSDAISAVAWYLSNSEQSSQPVGSKAPNALGLYDMSGNVYEWCWDEHGAYESDPVSNPHGPDYVSGRSSRSRRGGYYESLANYCRTPFRGHTIPCSAFRGIGFRVCRTGL